MSSIKSTMLHTSSASRWSTPATWLAIAGTLLGLGLFYRAGAISPVWITHISLAGLAIAGLSLLIRPWFGLLLVPATAPLYLIPVVLPNLRATPVALQLHEMVLLLSILASITQIGWQALTNRHWPLALPDRQQWWRLAPIILILIATGLGISLAVERGAALREAARMIIAPLLWYALLRYWQQRDAHVVLTAWYALIVAGMVYALLGLLQFIGIDLIQSIFGWKSTGGFTPGVVADGDVLRVTSVYGHPNNLALALGRIWPIAAVLAWLAFQRTTDQPQQPLLGWILVGGSLLLLAGIAATASRGAFLGGGAAGVTLILGIWSLRQGHSHPTTTQRWPWFVAGIVVIAVLSIVLSLRSGPSGGSTSVRFLLWREAITLISIHPLGLGPDQFYYYHNPEFGRSLIDPQLRGTSEQFASHPHNLILDLYLRLGPIGLLGFGWIIVRQWKRGISIWQQDRSGYTVYALGVMASLAAALIHGMVDNFYFVPDLAYIFWLVIALMDGVYDKGTTSG